MIPFPRPFAAMPAAPGPSGGAAASSTSRSSLESGTAPAGQFAEVFASMIPIAQSQGNQSAAVVTDAENADTEPGITETGQPASGSPKVSSVGSEPVETPAPAARATRAAASDAGLVMSQRVQHPSLSAVAVLPAGSPAPSGFGSPAPISTRSDPVGETGNEVETGSAVPSDSTKPAGMERTAEAASVEHVPGLQEPFPVAVVPWLEVPLPGTVAAPEVAPLSESGSSLSGAPTPGATAAAPELPAAPSPQALAVPAGVGPTGTPDPLAAGTNATTTITGPPVPAVPATGAQAPEPVPGTARVQSEPGAGADLRSSDAATVLAATEAVSTRANAVAQFGPPAVGQIGARIAPVDTLASALVSGHGGISSTDSLEAAATETPLVRAQAPAPLHRQLLGPIATLAAGPNGERTLSVNIAPEALGPITVKALLGGEGIRMELSAPTDAGREALRAMLPELRRDLAATGSGAITLATGSDSSATPGGHTGNPNAGGSDARPFAGSASPGLRSRDEPAPETPGQETSLAQHSTSHLDVMA